MEIYSIQCFGGRNIYSHRPVIKMLLDIGENYDTPTKDISRFNDRLLSMLPGIKSHYCSTGHEGGFVERLEEGTYLAHVTEHVILELQSMMGYDVRFGKARLKRKPSCYNIIYEYIEDKCAIECGRTAVQIINALIADADIDISSLLNDLRRVSTESRLGPSTQSILNEAQKRRIPVVRHGNESLLQLGYGKYSRLIQASMTDAVSCITADIASNKQLTKQILNDNGIPVPAGDIAYTEETAVALAKEIGFPVVIKPYDANQGKGVTLNIENEQLARIAYKEASKFSRAVMVEKYISGRDYRVLIVGDKVSAVSERRPPYVTGDGRSTVKQLVELENASELRGEGHERPLTRIKLDSVANEFLKKSGRNVDYIPLKGEVVFLRENGNLSTGGTARDCTKLIHPYNSMLAVKAAKAIGLDIAGIDITVPDISIPIHSSNGAVIEINAAPGLRMHLYPTDGDANNVAADIIDMMFPEGKPFTVPVVSITGTNGKTTTTRLVSHVLMLMGKKVGMTSTSGIYIGGRCIMKGDNTGPVSARMILCNKEIEAAVFETARGGLVRKGLGYDLADVGVVVNISEDHLGLDNVNTIEDLAYVKSLVIEAVKPDGYAVINADDAMAGYLIERVKGRMILFSSTHCNILVKKHIDAGGRAVYVEGGIIHIAKDSSRVRVINIDEVPITVGGKLECNIENTLAAVSALDGLNVPLDVICLGLSTFKPDADLNPGRFNIFDMGDYSVMLDYGHNPAGYKAVIDFVKRMDNKRLVGVIGMPGDRMDKNIREVGEMCARVFNKVYIKEDKDLRGRNAGEVAGLLFESVIKNGVRNENIEIIYSELKALEAAMSDAQPGDLIVMFYEDFDEAAELVNKFRKQLKAPLKEHKEDVKESAG